MDLTILIALAGGLLIILIVLYFLQRKAEKKDEKPQANRGVPVRVQEGIPRRAQMARNQRNRLRQNVVGDPAGVLQANRVEGSDEEGDVEEPITHTAFLTDEKMGAKKRAKLEAKEQKRLMREQELQQREERKAKEAKLEEERKQQADLEAEEERKQAEAERLAKEEKERKEYEEYLKMKEAFSVEEEGFEEGDDGKENALSDFIQYIKDNKVVVLEDLASEFKIKTQKAIERIKELQEIGALTGVIDDRGKFIYVSEEELAAVAKFIKQRGRVSITELAESSNNLINLTPVTSESS